MWGALVFTVWRRQRPHQCHPGIAWPPAWVACAGVSRVSLSVLAVAKATAAAPGGCKGPPQPSQGGKASLQRLRRQAITIDAGEPSEHG